MKSSDITLGDILAQEKDSYGSGKPVMALDNKSWTLGNDWVNDPENPGAPARRSTASARRRWGSAPAAAPTAPTTARPACRS